MGDMAWLDAPLCGAQVCSGSSAGSAYISNIAVEGLAVQVQPLPRVPVDQSVGNPMVWVVSDPEDDLFEQVVPEEITKDKERLFELAGNHLVRWKNSMHLVQQVARPNNMVGCGGEGQVLCTVRMSKDIPSFVSGLIARNEDQPLSGSTAAWLPSACVLLLFSGAAGLATVFRRRSQGPQAQQEFTRLPGGSTGEALVAGSPMRYSRLEAGFTSPMPRSTHNEFSEAMSPVPPADEDFFVSPRKRPAASRLHRERSL